MNAYLDVIMNALLVFPLMAVIFTLPYIIYNYRKYGSVFSMRILIVYSFVLYLLCAYFLVILPLPSMQEVELMSGPSTQLIPLHFLADIVKETPSDQPFSFFSLLHNRALLQMLFNIMMTIPFGIYLRYYFRCSFRKCVLYTFMLSLFFELTQLSGLYFIYPRSYRLFDVDDLLGNILGGIIGYGIIQPFLRLLPVRAQLDRRSYERGMSVSFGRRLIAFIAARDDLAWPIALWDAGIFAAAASLQRAAAVLRVFRADAHLASWADPRHALHALSRHRAARQAQMVAAIASLCLVRRISVAAMAVWSDRANASTIGCPFESVYPCCARNRLSADAGENDISCRARTYALF